MSVHLDGCVVLFVQYLTCCGDPCLRDLQPGGRERGCELLVCLDQYEQLVFITALVLQSQWGSHFSLLSDLLFGF